MRRYTFQNARNLDLAKTNLMAILNITADSFSGDGILNHSDKLLEQVERLIKDGADIIDIGGESTRPGATQISSLEELDRVIPAIELIRKNFDIPISIDSYKAEVAEAALKAGANIINDISALKGDAEMVNVAAAQNCPIILMHNSAKVKELSGNQIAGMRYSQTINSEIIPEVQNYLEERINYAVSRGITPENIILDPGIGFGKSVQQDLELLTKFSKLSSLKCPILIGPSRKSFIGHILNLPVDQRLEGTLAAVTLATLYGANIIRVHDVLASRRVIDFTMSALSSSN